MDWNRSEISELIKLYRQYECLWNPLNEDYNDCDAKQTAWMEIACFCGKEINDVRRKVKHLRSAYVGEKKKMKTCIEQEVPYTPNLFYFNEFNFLDSIVIPRKTPTSTTTSQAAVNKTINKQRKQKVVDRKSLRETKFNNAIDAIVASVQIPSSTNTSVEDESDNNVFSSFGKTTALQLQQLPLDKATETMSAIYQLITKRTLESLSNSRTDATRKRKNEVISFETLSP